MGLRPRTGALALTAALVACNAITGAGDYSVGGAASDGTKVDGGVASGNGAPSVAAPQGQGPGAEQGQEQNEAPPNSPIAVVAPDGLDFGDMGCGQSPPPRKVEIRNQGSTDATFQASLADGASFSVSPASGTVAAGSTAVLSVATPGVPIGGPAGPRTDTLHVTTNAPGDGPHALEAKISGTGAILKVAPAGPLDFGQIQSGSVSKTITIRNDGNVAATIAFRFTTNTVGSFSLDSTAPLTLEPGGVDQRTITAAPPKSGPTDKPGTLAFSSTSTLCGPVPPPISLACRRSD
jgi:hypothetical protein